MTTKTITVSTKDSSTICPPGGLSQELKALVGKRIRINTVMAAAPLEFTPSGCTDYQLYAKGVNLKTILEGATSSTPLEVEIQVVE